MSDLFEIKCNILLHGTDDPKVQYTLLLEKLSFWQDNEKVKF